VHTTGPKLGITAGNMYNCCRAIKEASAFNKMEIDVKERGFVIVT